ncbi:L-lactate dehydrogenase (cytochrome) [Exophiala aquamarina CBS 119918]|uniref:L-lactate dehydrogenase (Cytochrome) n=1 Tax=Exophiala aquamarina CBS 119918 TaxID=1182545 RepID=A0A072P4B4_9EURO|nr:L-lactate dehydrogenase (cytochrome) [Exophiala aquamarina CBS 119918]KEF54108.1 L-lactate dehydrogenase (cytochrome) [Exophiala aquamarina CBS 119918]
MVTRSEVRQHASTASCWVIIDNVAWDVTDLIQWHPGGSDAILRYAGKDVTKTFHALHAADTLEKHMKPK